MSDQKIIGKSFEEQLQNVLAARAVFCASKRGEFPALKPPHAFVIDVSYKSSAWSFSHR